MPRPNSPRVPGGRPDRFAGRELAKNLALSSPACLLDECLVGYGDDLRSLFGIGYPDNRPRKQNCVKIIHDVCLRRVESGRGTKAVTLFLGLQGAPCGPVAASTYEECARCIFSPRCNYRRLHATLRSAQVGLFLLSSPFRARGPRSMQRSVCPASPARGQCYVPAEIPSDPPVAAMVFEDCLGIRNGRNADCGWTVFEADLSTRHLRLPTSIAGHAGCKPTSTKGG